MTKTTDKTYETDSTFDPSSFEQLKKAESEHFWFKVRRKWIFERLRRFIAPPARILEIGCGTGNVSGFLAEKGYSVTGCEFYHDAIQKAWPGFIKVQGDVNNLPFQDNSFDIVGLFDIIEHFNDDIKPLKEARRVARKNGIIAVTVPSRKELWSYADEAAFHKRRYTKKHLNLSLSEANLDPLMAEYMFMSLYLPMKFTRNAGKKTRDQLQINKFVNTLCSRFFDIERFISKGLPLPIGTSLLAIAKKT